MITNSVKKMFVPVFSILGWACVFPGMQASLDHHAWINHSTGRVPGPAPLNYKFDSNPSISLWLALGLLSVGFSLCFLDYKIIDCRIKRQISASDITQYQGRKAPRSWLGVCVGLATIGMVANAEQIFLFFLP
jgi:hypothetical protein